MNDLVASVFNGVDKLPEHFVEAWQQLAEDLPFMSYEWFRNFTTNIQEDTSSPLIIVISNSARRIVAIFPLKIQIDGWFKVKRLCSLTNYYSPSYHILVDQNEVTVSQAINFFAKYLKTCDIPWDLMRISPINRGNHTFQLTKAFNGHGTYVTSYLATINWFQQVSDYQSYINTRPSKLVNTLTRKKRKLERNFEVEFELISNPNQTDAGFIAYQKIYTSSWKKPEPFPRFIPNLINTCAELGWLRLGLLKLNNEPVATQFWIVSKQTAYIYKLAYAPQFAKYSVGTILTELMMKHVIETDKVKKVDFLTGNDSYKREWMDSSDEVYGLQIINITSFKGTLLYLREILASFLKQRIFRSKFRDSNGT